MGPCAGRDPFCRDPWYEAHETLEGALIRERQIKKWKRDWKINLIERDNPHWLDLSASLML